MAKKYTVNRLTAVTAAWTVQRNLAADARRKLARLYPFNLP